MASTIMHMAVADRLYKKIKDKINIDYYQYMLGSISPDISAIINEPKTKSHFLDNDKAIPNIEKFQEKYKKNLTNAFTLGYFIHLYTDKLFYEEYYPLFIEDKFFTSIIKCLDKTTIKVRKEDKKQMLYNDYTNLNIQLIEEYNLNLDIFYNEFIIPDTTITEIPIHKLNLLIDNSSIIIQNISKEKEYIIDISSIKSFIDDCVEEIYGYLIAINIIQ
mgnify:CR=1 FL=1